AIDTFANVTPTYAGTIGLTSSDGAATLPGSHLYSPGTDAGSHDFSVTFGTVGPQTVTANDGLLPAATSGTIQVAPAGPTGVGANATSPSRIQLSWTASAGATSYGIYRQDGGAGPFTFRKFVTSSPYANTGLTPGAMYCYQVSAKAASGESGLSAPACATTPAGPLPPANVVATISGDQQSTDRVRVSWTPVTGSGP